MLETCQFILVALGKNNDYQKIPSHLPINGWVTFIPTMEILKHNYLRKFTEDKTV